MGSGDDVSTAVVRTLTAEVRVLMVGSRQITLSVAKQLDWLLLEHMEPFGRVRVGTYDRRYSGITWDGSDFLDRTVIGRSKYTGSLVLAQVLTDYMLGSVLCGCTTENGAEVHDTHYKKAHEDVVAMHRAASRLPLIVLAGLK